MRLVAVVGGLLCSHAAFAYGPEGHALVADMAELGLKPEALAEVRRLLAIEQFHSMDDVSSWADAYRTTNPDTGPFHFVDIPLAQASYDEGRDCHYDKNNKLTPAPTCIVEKLPEFQKVLADGSRPDSIRLIALKWVIHLVGDIHQPLHAEDRKDRGGNDVRLTYFGNSTNLHAIWDGGVIEHRYAWTLGPNYSINQATVSAEAQVLYREISADQKAQWTQGDQSLSMKNRAIAWANESHLLAPEAYSHLPSGVPSSWKAGWEDDYQAYSWPVIDTQLKKASVRLAEVLNESLAPN